MNTASSSGISLAWQAAGVKRFGPRELQRSSKTGSNIARNPDGNSTRYDAWPSHVARRPAPPMRDSAKLGSTMGILTFDVSGLGSLPAKRLLESAADGENYDLIYAALRSRATGPTYRKYIDKPCINGMFLKIP